MGDDVRRLFSILEVNGVVRSDELLTGCERLRGATDQHWDRLTLFADVHVLEVSMKALQENMRQVCLLLQHVRARSPSLVTRSPSLEEKDALEWLDKSTIDLKPTTENPPPTDDRPADSRSTPENPPSAATRSSPELEDVQPNKHSVNALSSDALRDEMIRRLRDAATTGEDVHTQILGRLDALGAQGRRLAGALDTPAESSVEVLESEIRNAVVETSVTADTLPGLV